MVLLLLFGLSLFGLLLLLLLLLLSSSSSSLLMVQSIRRPDPLYKSLESIWENYKVALAVPNNV
jgi:Flp pilus assembly protein protease CpaA